MLNNLSLKAKIILGNSITLIMMVILGLISITSMKSLMQTMGWVDHTHVVISKANGIIASAVDMETGYRGFLLAGKEEFLDPYKNGQENFIKQVAELSQTVNDNPAQVQLLSDIKTTITEWQKEVTEPEIALRREVGDTQIKNDMGGVVQAEGNKEQKEIVASKTMDDIAKVVAEAKGKVYFDKFRGQVKTFIDREASLMEERKTSADNTSRNTQNTILGGLILCAVLGIIISLVLAESVIRPFKQIFKGLKTLSSGELATVRTQFKEVTDGLANGAEQVASASAGIASGSSQQASSLEETSSSLEEMSSMTSSNANNANQANILMKESHSIINQANIGMSDLTQSMTEIAKASADTSKIIKTIDEIAFQTNLLALNAAVEAARAGEAGAGFAVVADEVRNLALRAAEAAKNTANLIEDTVKKVQSGSDVVAKTNESFTEVASSAGKVAQLISEIASASKEQAEGIDQVNKAVVEMDRVVQANAASTEELSSQSEELNTLVGALLQITEGIEANDHRAVRITTGVKKGGKGTLQIQHRAF